MRQRLRNVVTTAAATQKVDTYGNVDDAAAVDISCAESTLWKLCQTQNEVGYSDQVQNTDFAVAIDIPRYKGTTSRRRRE